MKRVRLQDVADKAGVAVNTASVILNNRSYCWASQATQERVFHAAEELGYRASKAAVGIRLGKFHNIGVVLPDLENPHYMASARLLEAEAQERGYDLLIEHSRMDLSREASCLENIFERQVDGVIWHAIDAVAHLPLLERMWRRGLPMVVLTAKPSRPLPADSITVDFDNGIRAALKHLASLGHRKIGFVSSLAVGQSDGGRLNLFAALARLENLIFRDDWMITTDHRIPRVQEAFERALKLWGDVRPTGVICLNDMAAIAVIRGAKVSGLRVPGDLSVIGIDDIPLAAFLTPTLTTIRQPAGEIARAAVHQLLTRIESDDFPPPVHSDFPSSLMVRESTAPHRLRSRGRTQSRERGGLDVAQKRVDAIAKTLPSGGPGC